MLTQPSTDQVLDFICEYMTHEGFPPTIRDMSAHFKRSTSVIWLRLRRLEEEGRIRQRKGKPRTLMLVTSPPADTRQSGSRGAG